MNFRISYAMCTLLLFSAICIQAMQKEPKAGSVIKVYDTPTVINWYLDLNKDIAQQNQTLPKIKQFIQKINAQNSNFMEISSKALRKKYGIPEKKNLTQRIKLTSTNHLKLLKKEKNQLKEFLKHQN